MSKFTKFALVLLASVGVVASCTAPAMADEVVNPSNQVNVVPKATQLTFKKTYVGVGIGKATTYTDTKGKFDKDTAAKDSQMGYLTYGGWQFDRVFGIETLYVNNGNAKDTNSVTKKNGKKSTNLQESVATNQTFLGAAGTFGYTFDNGIRLFGETGVGLAQNNLKGKAGGKSFDDDKYSVGFVYGGGVEYTPVFITEKVTVRAAYLGTVSDASDFTVSSGIVYTGISYNF